MGSGDITNASKYIDLAVTECGRERCVSTKKIDFTPKDYHMFHFIEFGKGVFESGEKQYKLQRGALFYIPPRSAPSYYPDEKDPWTYLWVGFKGEKSDALLNECGISNISPVMSFSDSSAVERCFYGIFNSYQGKRAFNLETLSYMYRMFHLMITLKPAKSEKTDVSQKSSHVEEAKQFIANNYQFSITVSDIARSLSLTPNYLANIFTEKTGESPKQYLTKYRMMRAQHLLQSSNYKVKEIAARVGFENQMHFSAEFRKFCGMSPIEYAKNAK